MISALSLAIRLHFYSALRNFGLCLAHLVVILQKLVSVSVILAVNQTQTASSTIPIGWQLNLVYIGLVLL